MEYKNEKTTFALSILGEKEIFDEINRQPPTLVFSVGDEYPTVIKIKLPDKQILTILTDPIYKNYPRVYVSLTDNLKA